MSRSLFIIFRSAAAVFLIFPFGLTPSLRAQIQWQTIDTRPKETTTINSWEKVTGTFTTTNSQVWEPLGNKDKRLDPEKVVWTNPSKNYDQSPKVETRNTANQYPGGSKSNQEADKKGFYWPNGQLMNESDQAYYRTAYSRGSMIQIGDTLYPNLGFNALQRQPYSWVNAAIVAIDDSRIARADCQTGNFFQDCSDGLLEARLRLWNSAAFSFDLHWTMHSLSGEGAPFNFSVGKQNVGSNDPGTSFGEGQSIGFVASKNFDKTFGMTLAGYRLFHFDQVTDLPRNFALYGTKIFRLNDSLEPPIISASLGIMTDTYNPDTNLGIIEYPEFLRGGGFGSNFAAEYSSTNNKGYYHNVAGVSSAFVCADKTVFAPYFGKSFKPFTQADPNCIKQVYLGPIASIGYSPWPWTGAYAKYSGTDIDLGISFKPFKAIPWTLSFELLNPIKGINPILDASYDFKECRTRKNASFSDCRTRVGIYTELSF